MHATPLPMHGDILTEQELDDAVHAVQREALGCGMIPIAGIMSRRREDGRHEVLGAGHNHLREGRPGIHGETGAIMDMGRLDGGYRDLVATSSLSPCPFCQRLLARHMGVREVRILDAANYTPDLSSYPATLLPAIRQHARIAELFRAWVEDDGNATVWARDIGIYDGPRAPVLDGRKHPGRVAALMAVAHEKARDGQRAGEAPIGAVGGRCAGGGDRRRACADRERQ